MLDIKASMLADNCIFIVRTWYPRQSIALRASDRYLLIANAEKDGRRGKKKDMLRSTKRKKIFTYLSIHENSLLFATADFPSRRERQLEAIINLLKLVDILTLRSHIMNIYVHV